jgi:RNA polymerase sigma-70 factor, ECF subfamily
VANGRVSLSEAIGVARSRVIAALAAQLRDLDLAQDSFAQAVVALLERGVEPYSTAAWLYVTARRKAFDTLRKRQAEARASTSIEPITEMAEVIELPDPIPDERLRLIFVCCHPALATEARVALALRMICGLPVEEIARVFVTTEAAMYQRITRAKAKIREAGIAFELPPRRLWAERIEAVLLTLELAYTVAYQDSSGERFGQLSAEIDRLSAMLAELLPDESEILCLAALVALARSREQARVGADGAMVPLSRQDVRLWDRGAIERVQRLLDRVNALGGGGAYRLMAAIQLTHARRMFGVTTDWGAIVALYDALLEVRPDPVVAINRASAIGQAGDPNAGLAALDAVEPERMHAFRPYHAVRGELLARAGRFGEAEAAIGRALKLGPSHAERLYLEARRAEIVRSAG